jgi:hypothetical protein
LKAIKIVNSIVFSDMSHNDSYRYGDSDTRKLAFECVMVKHNIHPASVYEMDSELIEKYSEQYESEINETFDKLILEGSESDKLYTSFMEYLDGYEKLVSQGETFGRLHEMRDSEDVTYQCPDCGKDMVQEVFVGEEPIIEMCEECHIKNGDLPF